MSASSSGCRSLLAHVAAIAAAASMVSGQSPGQPRRGTPVAITAISVPLNILNPAQTTVGAFTYRGGLLLTSPQSGRVHGLSDVHIDTDGRLTAVGDEGVLITARLVLDARGRLVGVQQGRLLPLTGTDGSPLTRKEDADAEGLAVLPNGDRLVSFERRHRILLYPANGGRPRRVPHPDVRFAQPNGGMEALAADPTQGADGYMAGIEASGETFTCRVSTRCVKAPDIEQPAGTNLVAVRRLEAGRTAYLFRGLIGGLPRIVLRLVRDGRVDAELVLVPPLTVDNFEGVAAVRRPGGVMRFYLLSDDNASSQQRTLLLAFDWQPAD